jgi:hypothetical protein
VKPDGSVAWIEEHELSPRSYVVHVADRSGIRTLASGTDIDPKSLALAGSTVYWTQGARPASTALN